jgi:hypothetical protein
VAVADNIRSDDGGPAVLVSPGADLPCTRNSSSGYGGSCNASCSSSSANDADGRTSVSLSGFPCGCALGNNPECLAAFLSALNGYVIVWAGWLHSCLH